MDNKKDTDNKLKETKTKNKTKKEVVLKDDSDSENEKIQVTQQKVYAISNPEFLKLKTKWHELSKKIEELNSQRDKLEEEKNSFVTEMCKILENYQPKVDNLIEQKSNNTNAIGKGTISSKILENDTEDSDSSDSDDDLPKKKSITSKKKCLEESEDDDSDSD